MSLISAIQTYLKTYTGLRSGAPVWVDYLGATPTEYAIIPLPGARVLEWYLDGGSTREYSFAFKIMESTAADAVRLDTAAFTEAFADWLEAQTLADVLPTLATGKTAESIEAVNWGYLEQQGESDTATYLITCRLVYGQTA